MKDFEIKERFLEDCIFEILKDNFGIDNLKNRGLELPDHKYWMRQMQIPGYGVSDIIGITKKYNTIYISIIELKKDNFRLNYLSQLMRYKDGVIRYLAWLRDNKFDKIEWHIETYLICKDFEQNSDDVYLSRYTNTDFYDFTFDALNGLKFNQFLPSSWHKKVDYNMVDLDVSLSDLYEPVGILNFDPDIPFLIK